MARIARLNDEYWVNFDNQWLYKNNDKLKELKKRAADVLEYLAEYPNCYKTWDSIAKAIDPDPAKTCNYAYSTIRGYINDLVHVHPVMEKFVQNKKGSGYIYLGYKADNIDLDPDTSIPKRITKNIVDVGEVASLLWKNRPFYQDDELISTLYYRNNISDSAGYDETVNYMIVDLLKQSYFKGKPLSLNKLPRDTSNKLIVIKESFLLEDVFCEGKHLSDYNSPYDLLELDEEKITMAFSGLNKTVKTSMWLSGMKACMPMRHLVKIVFESNRVFYFQVWGYFDQIDENNYYIKPLSVVYV